MNRTTAALVAGLTLSVAGGGAVVVGFASGLGGLDGGSLQSWSTQLAVTAPTVLICDNFDVADGDLDGRAVSTAASCGLDIWSVDAGTWTVGGGSVAADGTPAATASLPVAQAEVTVAALVQGADSGGAAGGVVGSHDGADTYLAAVIVGDVTPHVDLVLVSGGSPTTLTGASSAIPASAMLALTRDGTSVEVRVDGVVVLSYTLSAGDIATLGAGTRAGLYASSNSVQFDNLRVTTPSPN